MTDNKEQSNSNTITMPEDFPDAVFACPTCLFEQTGESFPSCRVCGLDWNFVLLEENGSWRRVNENTLSDWKIPAGTMLQIAEENIARHVPDAAFTFLSGKASEVATMQFVKVHFKEDGECPPFGVSFMLSNEIASMLHRYIGDFYAVPAGIDKFYAISADDLECRGLSPMKSLIKMLNSHEEEECNFARPEMTFYGIRNPKDNEFMTAEPHRTWRNAKAIMTS